MPNPTHDRDVRLVQQCLAGSEDAWNEFHRRYVGLVRNVVLRRSFFSRDDVDDATQNAFVDLVESLKTYDPSYPLPKFVAVVAERACIQDYRRRTASKRAGLTESVDGYEGDAEDSKQLVSELASQEEQLSDAQLVDTLKRAMRELASRCRELLWLRYYEEVPYRDISRIMGATENTLTVQVRRCLDELSARFREMGRKSNGSSVKR